jgi:anti-anti-sigma factor
MEVNKISEGNLFIFEFNGNLILSDLEKARKYVKEIIDGENANEIIFDLSNVDFIDSAGIGFIVSIFKSIKSKNGKFALASLKSKPHEVFKLTRLDKIIPIYENTEAAKQEF